jgi:hypothetical protein
MHCTTCYLVHLKHALQAAAVYKQKAHSACCPSNLPWSCCLRLVACTGKLLLSVHITRCGKARWSLPVCKCAIVWIDLDSKKVT